MRHKVGRWLSREERLARRNVPAFEDGSGKRSIFSQSGFEDELADREERLAVRDRIYPSLDILPPKERRALVLYFGLEGRKPHTYLQLSKILGISAEGSRQRVAKAVAKLREHLLRE